MHPRYSIDRIAGSKNQREGPQHSLTATRNAALHSFPAGGLCSPWRAAHSLPPRRRGPCRNEPVCWEHTFFFVPFCPLCKQVCNGPSWHTKKPEDFHLPVLFCGEGGIRTPGSSQINGFQDRRNRPLCHLSFRFGTANIGTISFYPKLFCIKCTKK